ncbi:MAG TPA: hypothetical protein VGM23_13570, partial [Armatimonadota bacterium]
MQTLHLTSADEAVIARLTSRIFAGDNAACFIERERILQRLTAEGASATDAFATLLSEVSTPIEDDDLLLGRVVEGVWPASEPALMRNYPVL